MKTQCGVTTMMIPRMMRVTALAAFCSSYTVVESKCTGHSGDGTSCAAALQNCSPPSCPHHYTDREFCERFGCTWTPDAAGEAGGHGGEHIISETPRDVCIARSTRNMEHWKEYQYICECTNQDGGTLVNCRDECQVCVDESVCLHFQNQIFYEDTGKAGDIESTRATYCLHDGTDEVCMEKSYKNHTCHMSVNRETCRSCEFIEPLDFNIYNYFQADCTNIEPMTVLNFTHKDPEFQGFFGIFESYKKFHINPDSHYPVCHGDPGFVPFPSSSSSSSKNNGVAITIGVAAGVTIVIGLLLLLVWLLWRRKRNIKKASTAEQSPHDVSYTSTADLEATISYKSDPSVTSHKKPRSDDAISCTPRSDC